MLHQCIRPRKWSMLLRAGMDIRGHPKLDKSLNIMAPSRTMQSYKSIIAENTTLVLSTDSDLFKFLKGMTPNGDLVPAPRSADNR
jgi:hypothetical protein